MEFARRAKGLPHGVLASIADSLTFLKMPAVDKYMSALSGSNGLKDYGP